MSENNDILDDVATESTKLSGNTDYNFPLEFTFKIGTMANDFIAKDSTGKTLAYVRQKMFKLKEAVSVYTDDSKSEVLYMIKADRWLDYNANYSFTKGTTDENLGRVGRKGRKSFWRATYEIFDKEGEQEFVITEENPWAKVFDSQLGIIGAYFFNPRYIIKTIDGKDVMRLSKQRSAFGRRFKLDKLSEDVSAEESERLLLGLMMMNLLERRRG
ncbi:MAG: hypothetical protein ACJAUD_001173 [Crocinitomicaceae bacterium]|jgi:uncharacterized protein YxjI